MIIILIVIAIFITKAIFLIIIIILGIIIIIIFSIHPDHLPRDAGLTVTCTSGYRLTTGAMSVEMSCKNESLASADHGEIPECVPVCWHECENEGKCVAPNVCKCQEGYWGKHCEKRKCIHPTEISIAIFTNRWVGTEGDKRKLWQGCTRENVT